MEENSKKVVKRFTIYRPDLALKKESIGYSEGSFVELEIKIEHETFNIQLYDKRDCFPFSIVRIKHITSNISSEMLYSEITRTARTTRKGNTFCKTPETLISRMSTKGANVTFFAISLTKI